MKKLELPAARVASRNMSRNPLFMALGSCSTRQRRCLARPSPDCRCSYCVVTSSRKFCTGAGVVPE
ncbi:hypothetical protein PF005_g9318 [Phytophthora fragariae]|uniref:Uncharacterized protein n=1 Tax=Phytophthora fragariae TaxID=53985 RepID=A0A6A3YC32_9STRA|nr:hypothetical protein PF003_g12186 [Phytophthora fragariae]KAE9005501.1 hypothetical protein PF011_g12016 [Phytophthora fragariae]KAE9107283.1 hypothetical protein PF010_g12320 [Phytophthora fragariae]KAE9117137.1 hypothetical protein PF007_g9401 [Phytophthora fragariae]KAE9143843.1 hypothetical protein PF006_g11164 [Phytophthora fragariae]